MRTPVQPKESRLFPILTLAAIVTIVALLPGRYRLAPEWFPITTCVALAAAMFVAQVAASTSPWAHVERYAIGLFAVIITSIEIAILARLLVDMSSGHPGLPALGLLTTAVGTWLTTVVIFSLVYWQLDRGGPIGRATGWRGRADVSFPRGEPGDGVPEDWQPSFADYLFLGFTTSTAFSPTDALPLTGRMKMLMMLQSLISLVTIAAVAARAINILGS